METNTKQIKHDDGTIETITEMKITRPDGSTETFRQTDKAHKQLGWTGKSPTKNNNNEKLSLTNGNKAKLKQLTNGTPVASSSSPKGKKGPYQLTTTNTNQKAAASTTTAAANNMKTETMTPGRKSTKTKVKSKELLQLDGPLVSTPPKTRRLI